MLKITLIACGNKMPKWVEEGAAQFQKRLIDYVTLTIKEVPLEKRSKSQSPQIYMQKEAARIQQAIPSGSYLIALDSTGRTFTSEALAEKLAQLPIQFPHLCLLIGGPDGLDPSLLTLAQEKWSLSTFTLPHPLVRVVLLEVLYRSFTILNHHPYHR